MAKSRVGVLEAYVPPDKAVPQTFCGRQIAEILVEQKIARRIGKRLIQVLFSRPAAEEIRWAKNLRRAAQKRLEMALAAAKPRWDGPLGVGNALPFSKTRSTGDKLHYEMPMAGDLGLARFGLFQRRDKQGAMRLYSHVIAVSGRNLFAQQFIA